MLETHYVLTVLGCNDAVTQCRIVETEQVQYGSLDECYADSEVMMATNADASFPVFLARCDSTEVAERAYSSLEKDNIDTIVTAELPQKELPDLTQVEEGPELVEGPEVDGAPTVAVVAKPVTLRPGVWYRVKPRAAIAKVAKPVKGVAEEAGDVASSAVKGAKRAWRGTRRAVRRLNPF